MSMDLVRGLLDQPVVDRDGRPMGRVDGIVLDVRGDGPPRVVSVAIGPAVLGERLHRTVGRWIRGLEVACDVAEGRPVAIAMTDITVANGRAHADVAAGDTAAPAVEQRVRGWIRRLPGA
jgi:hypothetical protein